MLSGRDLGTQIKQVNLIASRAYCVVLSFTWKSDDFEKKNTFIKNCTEELKCVMEILMVEHVEFSET